MLDKSTQPRTTKILICGSRTWDDRATMRDTLSFMPSGTIIVHGAARGADMMADETAREFDFAEPLRYPADWNTHGKAAGPIRNRRMLEDNPDIALVLAFVPAAYGSKWPGKSRGTANMTKQAMDRGIPVVVVRSQP